jgi:alpha-L-arabinofuranosidase
MQAIYFPIDYIYLKKNESFFVYSNHDEYSLWFNVNKKEINNNLQVINDQILEKQSDIYINIFYCFRLTTVITL